MQSHSDEPRWEAVNIALRHLLPYDAASNGRTKKNSQWIVHPKNLEQFPIDGRITPSTSRLDTQQIQVPNKEVTNRTCQSGANYSVELATPQVKSMGLPLPFRNSPNLDLALQRTPIGSPYTISSVNQAMVSEFESNVDGIRTGDENVS